MKCVPLNEKGYLEDETHHHESKSKRLQTELEPGKDEKRYVVGVLFYFHVLASIFCYNPIIHLSYKEYQALQDFVANRANLASRAP